MARPRRNEHIRENLLETGLALFSKQGYHGTGVKELVDATEVPKGSFYNYFKSKEDFAAEVIRYYAECYMSEWASYLEMAPGDDALAILRFSFEQMIAKHGESEVKTGCIVGNLAAEISESSPLCRQAMQAVINDWRLMFAKNIQAAQEQGTVRTDFTAEELADVFCNSWEGSLLRMKIENSTAPLTKCIAIMFDIFFRP